MNYTQARAYIAAARKYGWKLGLERMQSLMARLGDPQNGLRCYHVAGTNGKGSTTAYTASILAAAGFRVGVFISPYIERFTERYRIIDGQAGLRRYLLDETAGEIAPEDFAALTARVEEAVAGMLADGEESPTEFEMVTAVGFLYFAAQRCDRVVLETGLGGRLDSTNIIAAPEAAVITALGYDHMAQLGDTLPQIAFEKAGIIKNGRPTVLLDPHTATEDADEGDLLEQSFRDWCRERSSPLTVIRTDQAEVLTYGPGGQTFRIDGGPVLTTPLLGLYQPVNAALAMAATRPDADDAAQVEGVAATRWPARQELVREADPVVLIDGSHNLQSVRALAATMDRLFAGRDVVWVCGVMSDKDHREMLRTVLGHPSCRTQAFYAVTPENPRSLPAPQLAEEARDVLSDFRLMNPGAHGYNEDIVRWEDDPVEAAEQAVHLAREKDAVVCVFGSLYMVGAVRAHLRTRPDALGQERNP